MKKLERARAQERLQLQIRLQISDNEKLQKAREDQARAREDQAADQAAAESDGAEHVRLMEIEVAIERAKNREAGVTEAVTSGAVVDGQAARLLAFESKVVLFVGVCRILIISPLQGRVCAQSPDSRPPCCRPTSRGSECVAFMKLLCDL